MRKREFYTFLRRRTHGFLGSQPNLYANMCMVPILDGNSEHVEHASEKLCLFAEKIRFVTALHLIR